jgi:hypothetical protein
MVVLSGFSHVIAVAMFFANRKVMLVVIHELFVCKGWNV